MVVSLYQLMVSVVSSLALVPQPYGAQRRSGAACPGALEVVRWWSVAGSQTAGCRNVGCRMSERRMSDVGTSDVGCRMSVCRKLLPSVSVVASVALVAQRSASRVRLTGCAPRVRLCRLGRSGRRKQPHSRTTKDQKAPAVRWRRHGDSQRRAGVDAVHCTMWAKNS